MNLANFFSPSGYRSLSRRARPLTVAAFVLLASFGPARSQESPISPEETKEQGLEKSEAEIRFEDLEQRYAERLAEVRAPLIADYLAKLTKLKATLLEGGKTEAAARVESEIKWVAEEGWKRRAPEFELDLRSAFDRFRPEFPPFPRPTSPRRPSPQGDVVPNPPPPTPKVP